MKLKVRVFLLKFNAGISETQEILLIDFDFTNLKRCNFFTLTSCYGKFHLKTCTKPYQNRPRFMQNMTKTVWCVFRFTITAVHFQNANAKLQKVG